VGIAARIPGHYDAMSNVIDEAMAFTTLIAPPVIGAIIGLVAFSAAGALYRLGRTTRLALLGIPRPRY
jgi:hypothetical protein